jgi:Yip1 domain
LGDVVVGALMQNPWMKSSENELPANYSLGQQVLGVLFLKAPTYRCVVEDRSTKRNSIVIMLAATALSAVGLSFSADERLQGLVQGALAVVVGWIVPALVIPLLTQLMAKKKKMEISSALRLTGFTSVFAFGGALGFIPGVGIIGVVAGALLAPVGNTIGVREAIHVSTKRAAIIAFLAAFTEVGVAEILDRFLSPILK